MGIRATGMGEAQCSAYGQSQPANKKVSEALGKAAHRGQIAALEALLKEHSTADLATPDSRGMTVWDHAVIASRTSTHLESLQALLRSTFGDLATKILEFFSGVFTGLQIEGLAQASTQISRNYESELSGIYLDAYKGTLQSVPQESINRPDPSTGLTLLHSAALNGQVEVLEYLLFQGADKNLLTPSGQTALHLAALNNQTQALEYLASRGLAVNAQDNQGSTPLHYAMMHANTDTAVLLLKQGADPHATNHYELSPLAQFAASLKVRGYRKDALNLSPMDWVQALMTVSQYGLTTYFPGFNLLHQLNRALYLANPSNQVTITPNDSILKRGGKCLFNTCVKVNRLCNVVGYVGSWCGFSAATPLLAACWATNLPIFAHKTYKTATRSMTGIATAMKQFPNETYRPIRNTLVHLVNGSQIVHDWQYVEEGFAKLESLAQEEAEASKKNYSGYDEKQKAYEEFSRKWYNRQKNQRGNFNEEWSQFWHDRNTKKRSSSNDYQEQAAGESARRQQEEIRREQAARQAEERIFKEQADRQRQIDLAICRDQSSSPDCSTGWLSTGRTEEELKMCVLAKTLDANRRSHAETLLGVDHLDPKTRLKEYCRTMKDRAKELTQHWHPDRLRTGESTGLMKSVNRAKQILDRCFCGRDSLKDELFATS